MADNQVKSVLLTYSSSKHSLTATWDWDWGNTDHYLVRWWYFDDRYIPIEAVHDQQVSTSNRVSEFSIPDGAIKVWFHVLPVSKPKSDDNTQYYWECIWSTGVSWYDSGYGRPGTPDIPKISLSENNIKLVCDNFSPDYGVLDQAIEFDVREDDTRVYCVQEADAKHSSAELIIAVEPGHEYKARCRLVRRPGSAKSTEVVMYSDWSEFCTPIKSKPGETVIIGCFASSKTSVALRWIPVTSADSYDIQYISAENFDKTVYEANGYDINDKTHWFDTSPSKQLRNTESKESNFVIDGLESGHEYYFRVRSVNEDGTCSGWSLIVSTFVGTVPAAPTTWSSSTTINAGEGVTLYWVHNSKDNSNWWKAQVEISIDGVATIEEVTKQTTDEDEDDKSGHLVVLTSLDENDTTRLWRVRTKASGGEWGEWSVQRSVKTYTKPSLSLFLKETITGDDLTIITKFPFYIQGTTYPVTQTPVGWYVEIKNNTSYGNIQKIPQRLDYSRRYEIVNAGTILYSKYFDLNSNLTLIMNPNDIDLKNNESYTLTVTVNLDSGLKAEVTKVFTVSWADTSTLPAPRYEIGNIKQTASVKLHPMCIDSNSSPVSGVTLSVYRKDYDGTYVEIQKDIPNMTGTSINNTYVIDPYPPLDYARYRIIARKTSNGEISWTDTPAHPIQEKAIRIQWNETWEPYDYVGGSDMEDYTVYVGSQLILPYNIDISDSYDQDVSLVNYIGRKSPVSYYGTNIGLTSTWTTDIPKSDTTTLYALRRLANWTGDVRVREPSGSSYWANIKVSFGISHLAMIIPVTLNITRVEGGL